jgi:hypothetical protein
MEIKEETIQDRKFGRHGGGHATEAVADRGSTVI